jgi:eukaryotic-like serine/threonine-protein kinase
LEIALAAAPRFTMPAHSVTCSNCRAELRLKSPLPEGVRGANCPRCGSYVAFHSEPEAGTAPTEGPITGDTAPAQTGDARTRTAPDHRPHLPSAVPFLSPPEQPDEIGRLGPYRVLAELGRGGMGIVFHAQDTQLQRAVALKVMLPQYAANPIDRARFVREARAQARVEHYHVVQIFEVGEANGVPYLAMPLLKGQSLSAALQNNPRVPLPEAVRIAREMAEGLAAAHEKGLVHRDIKPGNVWLEGKRRRVKILDFGLARTAEGETVSGVLEAEITRHGAIIGTPAYMSPEQAHGGALDGRSDLFSLGIVLYQILAGRHPFRAPTPTALLIAIATENPPPPSTLNPEVTPALDALTLALLAKQPENRPATAEAVAEQLRLIGTGLTGHLPAAPTGSRPPNAPADPWENIDLTEDADTVALESETLVRSAKSAPKEQSIPWALAGGLLALLVVAGLVVAAVVIVRDKNGKEATRAEVPEGGSGEDKKGKERPPVPPVDPDRKAAEQVLNCGGKLMVSDVPSDPEPAFPPLVLSWRDWSAHLRPTEREVRNVKELPTRKFVITRIDLGRGGPNVNDSVLESFKGLKRVVWLELFETHVTDAGLVHLKGMTELSYLTLQRTRVTGAGLKHLHALGSLSTLLLNDLLGITDDSLEQLAGLTRLRTLHLTGVPVTGEGLRHLRHLRALRDVNFAASQATTAAGLKRVAELPNLTELGLAETPVTDDWLEPLAAVPTLESVILDGTAITDMGLERIVASGRLSFVSVKKAKVTASGIAQAAKLAPHTRIEWDGGVVEGIPDPERDGARYVLSVGGTVWVGERGDLPIRSPAEVPRGPDRRIGIDLTGIRQVTDAALAVFKGCRNVTVMRLDEVPVTAAGLANFAECKNLRELRLHGQQIDDAALAPFGACKSLRVLHLRDTAVTDAALKFLRNCPDLDDLWIPGCRQVGDATIASLADCKKLWRLNLHWTRVTDDGLAALKNLTTLEELEFPETALSSAGLVHLAGCKNVRKIDLSGCKRLDAAALAPFRDSKSLRVLWLDSSGITDAGLAALGECSGLTDVTLTNTRVTDRCVDQLTLCKNLTRLGLRNTQVTRKGVESLRAAVPQCQVDWDGGVAKMP